jgi:2-dehydropantoate 2-reductase
MRFIVYGAGGIGSGMGGHLFRRGHEVVLVGNAAHVEAIQVNGLALATGDETFHLRVPAVKTAPELAPFRADDVVLLTAKSQHTVRCLGQLRSAGAPRSLPIFCVQNSIWNEPVATRLFDRVYGVMIMVPGTFLTPGVVIHPMVYPHYGTVDIGCYPRGVDALCATVAEALGSAGYSAQVHADVMLPKGAKALMNLSNALDAITDGRGDERTLRDRMQQEAIAVWSTLGIEWEDVEVFRKRARARYGTQTVPAGYEDTPKRSSTWQSMARGTGNVEAEQLNGDVVTLGRLVGISTPVNALLWRICEEMARAGEQPGKYSAEDLLATLNGKDA